MVLTSPGQALGSSPDVAIPGAARVNVTQLRFREPMLGASLQSDRESPFEDETPRSALLGAACVRSKARIDVGSEPS